jgi:hypothetical protein
MLSVSLFSFSLLVTLQPVFLELYSLSDVWELTRGAAAGDGAYIYGTSQVGVKTRQESSPRMSWGQRQKPQKRRNTDNSSDQSAAFRLSMPLGQPSRPGAGSTFSGLACELGQFHGGLFAYILCRLPRQRGRRQRQPAPTKRPCGAVGLAASILDYTFLRQN